MSCRSLAESGNFGSAQRDKHAQPWAWQELSASLSDDFFMETLNPQGGGSPAAQARYQVSDGQDMATAIFNRDRLPARRSSTAGAAASQLATVAKRMLGSQRKGRRAGLKPADAKSATGIASSAPSPAMTEMSSDSASLSPMTSRNMDGNTIIGGFAVAVEALASSANDSLQATAPARAPKRGSVVGRFGKRITSLASSSKVAPTTTEPAALEPGSVQRLLDESDAALLALEQSQARSRARLKGLQDRVGKWVDRRRSSIISFTTPAAKRPSVMLPGSPTGSFKKRPSILTGATNPSGTEGNGSFKKRPSILPGDATPHAPSPGGGSNRSSGRRRSSVGAVPEPGSFSKRHANVSPDPNASPNVLSEAKPGGGSFSKRRVSVDERERHGRPAPDSDSFKSRQSVSPHDVAPGAVAEERSPPPRPSVLPGALPNQTDPGNSFKLPPLISPAAAKGMEGKETNSSGSRSASFKARASESEGANGYGLVEGDEPVARATVIVSPSESFKLSKRRIADIEEEGE